MRVFGSNFVESALPQVASKCQHVGLVNQSDVLTLTLVCQFKCVTNATLNTHARINTALSRNFVRCSLTQHSTFADVRTFGVFTNTNKVVWLGMARRSADERTLVDVQIKLEAHLEQQTALDDSGWNIRCADSTKKNRIKSSQLIQYVIRQDFAIAQETCSAEVEIGGVDVDSGRSDHFEGLDSDFGSDAVSADHGNTVRC